MVTEKFRRQLRYETERWWTEGLIDAALYERLADRYQFSRLEQDASHRFIAILIGLGAVLLGLGAITFVAANWQVWSRSLKVLLLLSVFIGVNVVGFYFWRSPHGRTRRLGQGLLLLGGLLLGANMALMSQMFHQSGDTYELLLVWGLGVVAMAYSLRLTSLGGLALILIGIGYWLGWFSWLSDRESTWQLMIQHMPLVVGGLFVPLAHQCRSRAIFGLSAVLVALSLVCNLLSQSSNGILGWVSAIAFTLPIALLWGYRDQLWQFAPSLQFSPRSAAQVEPFQAIARSLAVVLLSVLHYCLSFHGLWDSAQVSAISPNWQIWVDAIVLGIVAGLGWLHLLRIPRHAPQTAINSGTIALMLGTVAAIFIGELASIAAFAFNVMLFLLAIGLIRDGLALGSRHTFWGGMTLLVLGIVTRVLEYNTSLLLKSIVFAVCGIGVILAGLWFERQVKPPSFANPIQENLP